MKIKHIVMFDVALFFCKLCPFFFYFHKDASKLIVVIMHYSAFKAASIVYCRREAIAFYEFDLEVKV